MKIKLPWNRDTSLLPKNDRMRVMILKVAQKYQTNTLAVWELFYCYPLSLSTHKVTAEQIVNNLVQGLNNWLWNSKAYEETKKTEPIPDQVYLQCEDIILAIVPGKKVRETAINLWRDKNLSPTSE